MIKCTWRNSIFENQSLIKEGIKIGIKNGYIRFKIFNTLFAVHKTVCRWSLVT